MGLPNTVNQLFNGGSPYYIVNRSLRFRSSASAYLNRTPSVASNRKTFTWSGWVKRGTLGTAQSIFSAYDGSGNNDNISFTSANKIELFLVGGGGAGTIYRLTTAVYRDPSAWYHIVVSLDTTNATAQNRARIWVNGVEVTAFDTNNTITQNSDTYYNSTNVHNIGRYVSGGYLDGYYAEVNFVDGQQLTPSSFGIFDSNGIWQPIRYAGTYGTNGFYLPFNNTTSTTTLVADASGNGNNWTANNISLTAGATYDSMLDSPTNSNASSNYCVMNSLNTYAVTPSNGNLTASGSNAGYLGTMAIPSSGKWYWETVVTTFATQVKYVGIGQNNSIGTGVRYESDNGQKVVDGTNSAYGATWAVNDVMGVAVDADASTVTFYKNNVSQGSISYTFLTNDAYVPVMTSGGTPGSDVIQANFGQRPFTYTPPSGYNALNTANLPQPLISNGANYMAATLITGTGGSQTLNNGTNTTIGTTFQPDLVWWKSRSNITNNILVNSITGVNPFLRSNTTGAEDTPSGMTSFNSNGFSVNGSFDNTYTFVAWQWKAGAGTTSTNTSGSITSTVSVNTTAGFSVVTYTGNGSGSGATIGHGLGVAPSMIIAKSRSATGDWPVYHVSLGATGGVYLNLTNAFGVSQGFWNNTSPTSSVFSVFGSNANASGVTFVAYCFAAVRNYSAFGSYTGNGSADGPFIYTGFRPRFLMIKRSTGTPSNWYMWDSSRSQYNASVAELYPNSSAAEANGSNDFDFLSNGFKTRNTADAGINGNGETFIYMAFAENPFQISRAR